MRTRQLFDPDKSLWCVRHRLPGRVRLVGPALRDDVRLAKGIRTALTRQPGVSQVQASPASGTVLVLFDESQQSVDTLIGCIRHAHRSRNKTGETFEDREIEVMRSAERALAAIDSGLRRRTNGRIGLRKLALYVFSGRTMMAYMETGLVSVEAARATADIVLAWILFKHPRLERELEKVSEYVHPGA